MITDQLLPRFGRIFQLLFFACLIISLGLTVILPAQAAGTLPHDTASLVSIAPKITLTDKRIASFHVAGTLNPSGFCLRFQIWGQQPDQIALVLSDPQDNTPIVAAAGGAFMFYDPVASEVLFIPKVPTSFFLFMDHHRAPMSSSEDSRPELKFGFKIHTRTDNKGPALALSVGAENTLIDIPSILEAVILGASIPGDRGTFLLPGRTPDGQGRLVAHIQPSRKEGAYARVELFKKEFSDQNPFLTLDSLELNIPIDPKRFVFPSKQLLHSGLPALIVHNPDQEISLQTVNQWVLAFMARSAMAEPEHSKFKATVEEVAGHTLDWDKLKQVDHKNKTLLRSVFAEEAIPVLSQP